MSQPSPETLKRETDKLWLTDAEIIFGDEEHAVGIVDVRVYGRVCCPNEAR